MANHPGSAWPEAKDPGLGTELKSEGRLLQTDGTFNVERLGMELSFRDLYVWLTQISWGKFTLLIIGAYLLVNIIFASIYIAIGIESIGGLKDLGIASNFLSAFYFSTQTFTTVGFGHLFPNGMMASSIAAVESMTGLLSFALATGLLYGRFSRPVMRLKFSENVLLAPKKGGYDLHFRVANMRETNIMNLKAKVIFAYADKNAQGENKRHYFRLPLQIDEIAFFPMNWTIVHQIDEDSPLHNLSPDEMDRRQVELIIAMSGYDEAFGQEVHLRHSYIGSDIVWDAKFNFPFHTDEKGRRIFNLKKLNNYTLRPR